MLVSFLHLIQGIITGIAISISVGPIALITMKRTAEHGLRAGIVAAITVALIDTIVAILVLFGLNRSIPFFVHTPRWSHALGILIIFIYGLYLFNKKTKQQIEVSHPLKKHFYDTLLISLVNPSTYVSFGAIALLLTRFLGTSLFDRLEVIVGFFLGAILWWLMLVHIAFNNRSHIGVKQLQKTVGVIIMILAFFALITPERAGYLPFIRTIFKI